MSKYDIPMDMTEMSLPAILMGYIKESSNVLEFGCAEGRMTQYMHDVKNCNVTIVEIDRDAYNHALHYASNGYCGDAESLQWTEVIKNKKFNSILFADVLEHLRNPANVLSEAAKYLEDDGKIIVSIPNIAHADVLCNLYRNSFSYTELGLLDNTHIHFWGEKELEEMATSSGLSIVEREASYVAMHMTEQGIRSNEIPGALEKLLNHRDFNDVYQFVLVMQKRSWVRTNNIQLVDHIIKKHTKQANIYFDTGKGYNNEERKLVNPIDIPSSDEKKYLISEIPDNCRIVRFDPSEELGIFVRVNSIRADNVEVQGYPVNGIGLLDGVVFFSEDPYYEIPLSHETKCIEIKASVKVLSDSEILAYISQLFGECCRYKEEIGILNNHLETDRLYQEKLREENSTQKTIIRELEDDKQKSEENKAELNNRISVLEEQLTTSERQHRLLKDQLMTIKTEKTALEYSYGQLHANIEGLSDAYLKVTNSRSWRYTEPVRRIKNIFKKKKSIASHEQTSEVLTNDTGKFSNLLSSELAREKLANAERIDVITTAHTKYVAEIIKKCLNKFNIDSDVFVGEPEEYRDIPYFIVCPQFVEKFPPVYMAVQMEQTVSSRWLTDEYIEILENAYAVLDYSMNNVEYFSDNPVISKKMYYLPLGQNIDLLKNYQYKAEKNEDVIFYGDPFSDRRMGIIEKLKNNFNLTVISNSFGEELYDSLCNAKVLVNIHYYQKGLLETTRLYEALSLGNFVIVSEHSDDVEADKALEQYVDFVPVGDTEALIDRISYWISHNDERMAKVLSIREDLYRTESALNYYVGRFLLANDSVSFEKFYETVGSYVNLKGNRICLNLPESTDRRKEFESCNRYGFEFFPGLKYHIGWVGCAMSYKMIALKALEQNMDEILVCEDDVLFDEAFDCRFAEILDYLKENKQWDVFSGIMSDIGDISVSNVGFSENETFACVNRMISMVFNIYKKTVIKSISEWDQTIRDVKKNTIDRYLEGMNLHVLTTVPFLVGHKENLNSTLWGASNTIYTNMINNSNEKLSGLVVEYLRNNPSN